MNLYFGFCAELAFYVNELSQEFSFFVCMLAHLSYVTLRLLKVTAARGGARVDVLT